VMITPKSFSIDLFSNFLLFIYQLSLFVLALPRCMSLHFPTLNTDSAENFSVVVSQRPTYVEVGPLMTARFGEVR